jgi:hypothetical protein
MKRRLITAFILSFLLFAFTSSLLAKSVSGYTRKDGTYVSGYDRGGSNSYAGTPDWTTTFGIIMLVFAAVTLVVYFPARAIKSRGSTLQQFSKTPLLLNCGFKKFKTAHLLRQIRQCFCGRAKMPF